jgi:hypothetical protein
MSAASVRAAVASYLTAAAVPNLTVVLAEADFDMENVPLNQFTQAGATTTSVGIVYIDDDIDAVIGLDGAGGRRKVAYSVSVEVLVQDVSGVAATGQGAYDGIVQGLKFALRTDPQLGTATTAGLSTNGGIIQAAVSRLQGEYGRPVRLGTGNAWTCWMRIAFAVETFEYST